MQNYVQNTEFVDINLKGKHIFNLGMRLNLYIIIIIIKVFYLIGFGFP